MFYAIIMTLRCAWRLQMKITKKQQLVKSTILNAIYVNGPISRIDISKETGITPATISSFTNDMIQENLVCELGEADNDTTRAGRKRILLAVNGQHSYYIGVELSEKYMTFVLTNNVGQSLEKEIIKFPHHPNFTKMKTSYFFDCFQTFHKKIATYPIAGVGIALPGHYDPNVETIVTNNPLWSDFSLLELKQKMRFPIYFANNVDCMGLAERIFFHCFDDFSFFHIGRGMHCTYIYNGEIYAKHNFIIGEIGHTVVHLGGELCECGKRGCLQTYASEAWLLKKAHFLYRNSLTTFLRQLVDDENAITMKTILAAYHLGDEGMITLLNIAIEYIATAVKNMNMLLATGTIFLHGEIFCSTELTNLFYQYLGMEKNLLNYDYPQTVIVKPYSEYNGAIGATALCIDKQLLNHE